MAAPSPYYRALGRAPLPYLRDVWALYSCYIVILSSDP